MTLKTVFDTGAELDFGRGRLFDRQIAVCPACGSDRLEPVGEHRSPEVNLYCRECSRCWHTELGRVLRITPPVCFGCHERDRCEAVYEADQARAQRS